ncbi:MAG TPA: AraC family transcriptional regulator [Agriterribacter sp.]|nr:AraC family transcriptional regulator [Agriterribacter sp.]
MNPLLQDIEPLIKDSLYVKEIKKPNLDDKFHFHNAHEIALMLKGYGKRIVGDNIEYFSDGDLVIIGKLLPHATYIEKEFLLTKQDVHALVVYFRPDWFSDHILHSSTLVKFRRLMKNIERGIRIFGRTQITATRALLKLRECEGLERIINLVGILDFISKSAEYECLSSESYSNSYGKNDVERLGQVYKYVMENYGEVIKLQHASCLANMTESAFSKYFKIKTGKTFSNFVNDVRIGQACKLLINDDLTIAEICYSCGFNNLINFNRTFKNLTKMTPTEYRKNFLV